MIRSRLAVIAGLAVVAGAAQAGTWYTTEAAFQAAINAVKYTEDFSNFTFGTPLNGSQTTWVAPGANGYGFTSSATGGLYSNVSAMSTNLANDPLVTTFTGNPVSAFGGLWANSDISGNRIPGTITVTLTGGSGPASSFVVTAGAVNTFLGWVGNNTSDTIASASAVATGTTNNWVELDHAIVGARAVVPEPATMVGLTVGALALLRRRKK